MNWVRIDVDHNLRNPERRPNNRVYGFKGKLWPRLSLSVDIEPFPTYGLDGDPEGENYRKPKEPRSFCISIGIKIAGGRWWTTRRDLPLELLPEVQEMLTEIEGVG